MKLIGLRNDEFSIVQKRMNIQGPRRKLPGATFQVMYPPKYVGYPISLGKWGGMFSPSGNTFRRFFRTFHPPTFHVIADALKES